MLVLDTPSDCSGTPVSWHSVQFLHPNRWSLYKYINSLLRLQIYVQAEMSLKGSWFTVCWYIISCSSLIMRFFSVIKLFTKGLVFVWKILLGCSFISHNTSGHTQVENFFWIQFWQMHQPAAASWRLSTSPEQRARAGFGTIMPILIMAVLQHMSKREERGARLISPATCFWSEFRTVPR